MIRTIVVTVFEDSYKSNGKSRVENFIAKTDAPDTINRKLTDYIKASINTFVDDVSEDGEYFR